MADDPARPGEAHAPEDGMSAHDEASADSLLEAGLEPLDARFYNRRYRAWLTVTGLLSLATLTLSIIVIIIARARDVDREADFEVTLTAVWQAALAQPVNTASTPTAAPLTVPGVYPFVLTDDVPVYGAGETCDQQVLTGRVTDLAGSPTDAFSIRVWGDYTRLRNLLTGALADEAPGVWRLVVPDAANRRLWVQLAAADRYLSAPVEVVFVAGECDRNRAQIDFQQVGGLN